MSASQDTSESPSLRLARYLKEFIGLRSTTIRDISKYEKVIWFGDMPQDADCRSGAWLDGLDLESPWLEVHKQVLEGPPEPPVEVQEWVDAVAIRKATPQLPPLLETVFEVDLDAELSEGESPPLVALRLQDHPEVVEKYESYRPSWEAWSADHRRREAIQEVYADLFGLHTQLQKQGEVLEVVLGIGLLDWPSPVGNRRIPIRRHVVVAQVAIEFDAPNGVIRVLPPSEGASLSIEDDMLEAELRPDRSHYSAVEAQLEEIGDDVWDGPQVRSALRAWGGAVSANTHFCEDLSAKLPKGVDPVLSFAPALILRARPQVGMVRVYERIIEELDGESGVPDGWARLTDDAWGGDWGSDLPSSEDPDDSQVAPGSPDEVFFPLPANREQRRVIEALSNNQGVLVQGPPGTGKSHSIANLICHLLATGKRVLITAETGRALRVLKDKLPEEIQPLCVSLLGQGGDAFAELNRAVQGITNRQASFSEGASKEMVAAADRDLDTARRELAAIDTELRSLREDEAAQHSLLDGAYLGTASSIAGRVSNERVELGWIQKIAIESRSQIPSDAEATRWLELRRRYTDEAIAAANLRTPSSSSLAPPADFAQFVASESQARESARLVESLREHEAYSALCEVDDLECAAIAEQLQAIERQRLRLESVQSGWLQDAVLDMASGRSAGWLALADRSGEILMDAENLLARVGGVAVDLPAEVGRRKIRGDVVAAAEHLEASGKWKRLGVFTPKPLKGRTYLRDQVRVDGQQARTAALLRVVQDSLDLEFAVEDLRAAWQESKNGQLPRGRRLLIAEVKADLDCLTLAIEFAKTCDKVAEELLVRDCPIPVPSWIDGEAQEWLSVINAIQAERRACEAERQVEESGAELEGCQHFHDVHPLVESLQIAIEYRDVASYSKGLEQLREVEQARLDAEELQSIQGRLDTAAPGLVEEICSRLDEPQWDERLSRWSAAWYWHAANDWLERRSDFHYQRSLVQKRREADNRVRQLVAHNASLRAWSHFFRRLSAQEANALRSWREAVRAMGKGTGKSARLARLKKEARGYMDACRDAIPIWIMPRFLVAEMLDPTPGRYDLVIVDEASQLGIESLFLFFIAKKIIVVGDDQQISPAGVGVADSSIAGLQQHFLEGLPHQHALSPQSSLYANAKIRFNQNIVLREHFRCMPEIIQFSNDLCYASNGTPLDPLRADSSVQLAPLVVRHVADGYREGGPQRAQNRPEADALVAQLCACIEDERYKGMTMGVISLQGEAQARLIEDKLHQVLEPEVIHERKIICGDAYAFQGDERHVIFLSMVAAPGEKRIGVLSNDAARQRFNVAASRAQDQLWLFHTAELESLSSKCMRHHLLSYMLEPQRRTTSEGAQVFDSDFERQVYRKLTERGFHVRSQVQVGDPTNHRYRIDLVVEGMRGRLAVECDGDQWHGPEQYESDMARQRDLERAGWQFARIRGGDFYRDPDKAMAPIFEELDRLGIDPGGIDSEAAEPPPPILLGEEVVDEGPGGDRESPETPQTDTYVLEEVSSELDQGNDADSRSPEGQLGDGATVVDNMQSSGHETAAAPQDLGEVKQERFGPGGATSIERVDYVEFVGEAGPDPRLATAADVAMGLCEIIDVEGPVLAKRAYDVYLRGCGIRRMGGEIKREMNRALQHAIRSGFVSSEDESRRGGLLYSIVRAKGTPPVVVRTRGPRTIEQIPASELQFVARRLSRDKGLALGSEQHLRAVLQEFDLKRLTKQVETRLADVLAGHYPEVDRLMENEQAG